MFDSMVNREDSVYVHFQNKKRRLSFNLKSKITLADSKSVPGLQLADVIASAASQVFKSAYRGSERDGLREWRSLLEDHLSEDCIWPDFELANLSNTVCFANTLILHELIDRSLKKEDLFEGLPSIYRTARRLHPKFLEENPKHLKK